MSPRLPAANLEDGNGMNPESKGQLSRHPAWCLANFAHGALCKFGATVLRSTQYFLWNAPRPVFVSSWLPLRMKDRRMLIAAQPTPTALSHHVVHIVLVGAGPEVRESDARGVIAAMEDEHSWRGGTVRKFPCNAMSAYAPRADSQLTVSVRVLRSDPFVTPPKLRAMRRDRSVLVRLGLKSFCDRLASSHVAPPGCDLVRGRLRENVGGLAYFSTEKAA